MSKAATVYCTDEAGFCLAEINEGVLAKYEVYQNTPFLDYRCFSFGSLAMSVSVYAAWQNDGRAAIAMVRVVAKTGTIETQHFVEERREACHMIEDRLTKWLLGDE